MAKPWAKYEINWINHDKFRALNANAICLWQEGKNYCDRELTDGLIPFATAKQFRFYSKKAMEMLTTTAGLNPRSGVPYTPLWECVDGFGYKMHAYLEYNDSRDVAMARKARAEAERQADRDRKAAMRAAKSGTCPGDVRSDVRRVSDKSPTLIQHTEDSIQKTEEQKTKSGGSKRPIYQSDRFVVFEWQLDELARMLGPHVEAFDLHAFFDDLSRLSRTEGLVIPGDREARWRWLQAQTEAEARRRGLPMAQVMATEPLGKLSSRMAAMVVKARRG